MREIENVLERSERVVWEGAPASGPFILARLLIALIMGPFVFIFFTTSNFILFGMFMIDEPRLLACCFIPIIISAFLTAIMVSLIVLSYKNTYYGVTTKRMVIQKGIVGRDYKIVEFRNITHAEVNVSFLDKIFNRNTGSLKVHTAGTGGQKTSNLVFENIQDPYELFKLVNRKAKAGERNRRSHHERSH